MELKDNALQPGEAAMILYEGIETNGEQSTEVHYTRIKVFKEEGKKYADVQIAYVEGEMDVENIQARAITPEGQAVDFGGEIFDKVVVRSRRLKVNLKSFTIPNVTAGSIIEYAYRLHFHRGVPGVFKDPARYLITGAHVYPAARWYVQRDLFVRRAHLVLRPASSSIEIHARVIRLPKVAEPQMQPDHTWQLDIENIPALHREEYSLPEDALNGWVYIFYAVGYYSDEGYWTTLAKYESEGTEKFLSKSKAARQEVARLFDAGDPPETKLRKIYERVQQVRPVSFEPSKTEKEQKRENLKPNKSVDDVLTRNYAFANEINLAFVALAREAGFQANPARVTSRVRRLFTAGEPDPDQLDAMVVEVRMGLKTLFLDPATLYCPFGFLPWEESDTGGVMLGANSTGMVQTPAFKSSDSVIDRHASLKIDSQGALQGRLDVSFLGQEALDRRIKAHNQDDAGRKKDLEEEAQKWLPANATAKLVSAEGWEGTDKPLKAAFDVTVPDFGSRTGDRLLFPVTLFQSRYKNSFLASKRENAVYLRHGFQELDDVVLETPPGYKVEHLPVDQGSDEKFASYNLVTEQQGTTLKLKHQIKMERYYFLAGQYPVFRDFLGFARTMDDEQVILRAVPAR